MGGRGKQSGRGSAGGAESGGVRLRDQPQQELRASRFDHPRGYSGRTPRVVLARHLLVRWRTAGAAAGSTRCYDKGVRRPTPGMKRPVREADAAYEAPWSLMRYGSSTRRTWLRVPGGLSRMLESPVRRRCSQTRQPIASEPYVTRSINARREGEGVDLHSSSRALPATLTLSTSLKAKNN